MNDKDKKRIHAESKEITKKDVIFGLIAFILIILCVALFILLAFESKLPESVNNVLDYVLPGLLFLGGGLLIVTYFIEPKYKKMSFLIGGIVICIAAITLIVLRLTGVIEF